MVKNIEKKKKRRRKKYMKFLVMPLDGSIYLTMGCYLPRFKYFFTPFNKKEG